MKLAPQQLVTHLKQGIKPLYILTGDEPLGHREALDAIRATARAHGYIERTTLTADRYFKWQEVSAFAQSNSLFASLRLLEINIPSGKPGTEGATALESLSLAGIQDAIVIVILPKIDWKDQKTAWFSALQQNGVLVELNEVAASQLPQWIAERMALQGQSTDKETLQFMARQVEGNLLAAHQEIQKLGLLFPQGNLAAADVRNALLNVSRFDAFQLGEAVLTGDSARTIRILQGLKEEGEQPVMIMTSLLWLLRPLAHIKQSQAKGASLNNAIESAKVRFNQRQILEKAASRLSLKQMEAAMHKLTEIDKTAKGLMPENDVWLELSRLCFGLARIRARTR